MNTTIDVFTEFAWAVPKAFSVPLRDCRFEQGDRLYNTPKAYEGPWADALKHIEYSIEVVLPPRGPVVKSDKDSASVFANNWPAPVELVLTRHKEKQSDAIKTTQGNLYTALWHGNLSVLDSTQPELPMPFKSVAFTELAQHEVGHFLSKAGGAKACSMFLTPWDETNDIFSSKASVIQKMLADTCPFEFHKERPHVVYGKDAKDFAPTLYLGCYVIDSTDKERLEAGFKKALYVPVKNKITDRENWKLEKHGQLVQVGI